MKKPFFVRLDEEIVLSIEKLCAKYNISKAELISNAIKNYNPNTQLNKDEIKALSFSKPIPLKYPNKRCIKCGKTLSIGELVLISKTPNGYIYLCYECFLKQNQQKDYKQLLKAYIKLKRIKALIDEAEKRLNQLVNKINIYECTEYLLKQIESIKILVNDISSYIYSVHSNADLKNISEQLTKLNEQLEQYLALMRKTILKTKEVNVYAK